MTDDLLELFHKDILRYVITEYVNKCETYCHRPLQAKDLTYAEVSFEDNEIIIKKIKCGTCYCEPKSD